MRRVTASRAHNAQSLVARGENRRRDKRISRSVAARATDRFVEIVLAHYRGFDVRRAIKENDCAALESWMAAVSTRPSMQYTLAKIENMTGKTLANAFIDHFAKFVSWRSDSSGATVSA